MKTITLYNAKEVQELGTEQAFNKVKEDLQKDFVEVFNMHESECIISTMNVLAQELGLGVEGYCIDIYYPTHYTLSLDDYSELTNEEKNEAVKYLNDTFYQKDFDCPLTGTYTDFYIKDYLTKEYPNGVTYNDMTWIVKRLGDVVTNEFIKDAYSNLHDIECLLELSMANENMWDIEGDKY